MLSRRHLRIKVLQSLYCYFSNSFDDTVNGEKALLMSINRFYELFLYQLQLMSEIHITAQKHLEESKNKFLPKPEEINPNLRFVENKILCEFTDNTRINDLAKKNHISWTGENEIARKIFTRFRTSREYKNYISTKEENFEEDKNIIITLLRHYINDFSSLVQFYEEHSIFWVDDIDIVNLILEKIIKSCSNDTLERTFNSLKYEVDKEDEDFAVGLFHKTIIHSEEYEKMISQHTKNWETDRIAVMDFIIMKMAMAEILEFPSIPVKVTLNEYIDLAKMYSTPKSSIFVNGVLDKILIELKGKNLVKKTGRGLMQ